MVAIHPIGVEFHDPKTDVSSQRVVVLPSVDLGMLPDGRIPTHHIGGLIHGTNAKNPTHGNLDFHDSIGRKLPNLLGMILRK